MTVDINKKSSYSINDLPDVDEMLKNLIDDGFIVQKVSDSTIREYVSIVGDNNIGDLTLFAKKVGVKLVFVDITYLDKEQYLMTCEDDAPQVAIREFNKLLDSVDFNKPYDVYLTVIYEGQYFGVFYVNRELKDFITNKHDIFMKWVMDEHQDEIHAYYEQKDEKRKEEINELINKLANEPEFMKCTNQNLRLGYLGEYLKKTENKKYIAIISGFNRNFVPSSISKRITDRAWAIVKNR